MIIILLIYWSWSYFNLMYCFADSISKAYLTNKQIIEILNGPLD